MPDARSKQSRTRQCRVFFAVWPDAAAAGALHGVARENGKVCGGRVMRRDSLHITLAFLGDIPTERVAALKCIAGDVVAQPFDLAVDRLGYWRHNRILWAGADAAPLTVLAERLTAKLASAGFRFDARPFVPHMTLLRDADCAGALTMRDPVCWPVTEFLLVRSGLSAAGAHYEAIGRWPLLG
jgi:RNA 2',3'-cyclic 3'-phosphodiesterase